MLKLKDVAILNAFDLKKEFSPWTAYENIEAFEAFARVHCVPLAHILEGSDGAYRAAYLKKDFWLEILNKGLHSEAWPEETLDNAASCFLKLVKEAWPKIYGQESQDKGLKREIQDAAVEKKLAYIVKEAGFSGSQKEIRTSLLLLSMCELAEADVFAQNFQRWEERKETAAKKIQTADENVQGKEPAGGLAELDIRLFPEADNVPLKTSSAPYCFWYYSEGQLKSTCRIKTVRVEAVHGGNQFEKVCIQLYDCNTKEQIQTIYLNIGEYRDCNIADGKVIKFLPSFVLSENLCLVRENCCQSQLTVIPKGAEGWKLGLDEENSRKVTSFAVGEESNQGILLIRSGKLITGFYKPCEEFAVKMALRMIGDVLVEVCIGTGGYRLLTEDGTVLSDDPAWNGKRHMVTVSEDGRGYLPQVQGEMDVQEAISDEKGTVLALRYKNGTYRILNFQNEGRRIQAKQDGGQSAI